MEKRPSELSQGMRQRCGIARAFALQPKMLLLDEPFGMLDSLTRYELQDVLLDLWQRDQKTALMVTHDVDEALFLSDRIVMMTDGPEATVGDILTGGFPRHARAGSCLKIRTTTNSASTSSPFSKNARTSVRSAWRVRHQAPGDATTAARSHASRRLTAKPRPRACVDSSPPLSRPELNDSPPHHHEPTPSVFRCARLRPGRRLRFRPVRATTTEPALSRLHE
jgi:ABC-type sulfate/molybdate transport systems ATPase subunit